MVILACGRRESREELLNISIEFVGLQGGIQGGEADGRERSGIPLSVLVCITYRT